jgi:hypothetical protein
MLDAPLFGSPDNYSFSTIQVNISPLSTTNLSSLGYSGRSHTDRHDDPMSLTLLICISNLADTTDPGKFYIGETREWCTLYPFSLLIFRGTGPHGGTQATPQGPPKEWEKRINLILYPRREFINRTLPVQYPCYEKTRLSDYSFFHDGAACFGNPEYHTSWAKRELFRHFEVATKPYGPRFKSSELQTMYRVIAGRTKRYIDPNSAEGVRITKDIETANKIMGDVRPQWKDARKQCGRKAGQSTAQPETLVVESPMQPESSSRKTKQAATIQFQSTQAASTPDIIAETIPPSLLSPSKITRSISKTIVVPAVMSQRTTRRTSNTTVTIPVASDSGVSEGLARTTASIVPSTQTSISTGRRAPKALETTPAITASGSKVSAITRPAAALVTPKSRTTRSQKKQGTVEVLIEIDNDQDQDQSMEDSGNNSTVAEGSDSDELHTEDSDSDDWDNGHLTDNIRDATPSIEKSTPNETALKLVHYTTVDNSVVEPACRSDLASILQKTSLFNESELRWQQADLVSEGLLLRQQYRGRKPSVQNVLPNPSSLKLPETNGPTLVEQLMQLGERCQWITQKHEAIKGYLRALDEHLLLTLLGVEQLFDSRYLKRLFECRWSGAGICTKRLMDKVEEMVRKSMNNSKAGDTRDETFQFNVKEILGSQYQPKFCVSVEITMKPYDGKDEYRHMAQHFREVHDISH